MTKKYYEIVENQKEILTKEQLARLKEFEGEDEDMDDDDQQMFEHFRLNAEKGQTPVRLDKYMSDHLLKTSRSRIQAGIKAGYVTVNDVVAKSNYLVRPLDVIKFAMPYERRGIEVIPQNIPLDIVYEDEHLMLVNKPAGMVVHPGHGNFSGTLINALTYYLDLDPKEKDDERMGVLVHRIDKDTSGLLLVAKNQDSQVKLSRQFFEHTIERKYVAVVWGNIEEDEGTIDYNIARDPSDRICFKAFPNQDIGKTAVTHYRVLERMGFITVVECILETGRTHQIRVHMKSIGHPLFNDERYGGSKINNGTIYAKYKQFILNCFKICPRQALHAKTLGFEHPVTGERMFFDSPLPEDMTTLIEKWRAYADQVNKNL